MKKYRLTFFETAGHGYLSVPKKLFLVVGGEPEKISKYSGHTYTNLYLEEDCDACYFLNKAKDAGVDIEIKNSYVESFSNSHNYNPKFFNYKPAIGDLLTIGLNYNNPVGYWVDRDNNGKFILKNKIGITFKMPSNIFTYFKNSLISIDKKS